MLKYLGQQQKQKLKGYLECLVSVACCRSGVAEEAAARGSYGSPMLLFSVADRVPGATAAGAGGKWGLSLIASVSSILGLSLSTWWQQRSNNSSARICTVRAKVVWDLMLYLIGQKGAGVIRQWSVEGGYIQVEGTAADCNKNRGNNSNGSCL
jgi:hypothetical protein